MGVGSRFQILAVETLTDPTASTDELAEAERILTHGSNPDASGNLSDVEIDLFVHLIDRMRGTPPEPIDAYSARDRAAAIQAWADELQHQATELAKGKAVPPSFVFRCKRCSDLSDEDLRCKRCREFPDDELQNLKELIDESKDDDAKQKRSEDKT